MPTARSSPITTGTSADARPATRACGMAARPGLAYRDLTRSGGTVMRGHGVRARACGGKPANRPARAIAAGWAAAALVPSPAFAWDGSLAPAISIVSVAIAVAALGTLAVLARRLREARDKLAAGAGERQRLAGALAELDSLIAAAPSAAFRWRLADGSESFSPGLLETLHFSGTPRFADLLDQLVAEDTTFLAGATEALRASGTPFALTLGIKGDGAVDAIGRRVLGPDGKPIADVVWLGDARRRAAALADAAGLAAEQARLRAVLNAL